MEERLSKREKKKIKGIVFLLLSILWMTVIFMFSAQTGDESDLQSGFLTDMVCNLVPFELSEDGIDILTFIIRKAAHFTEYAVLGALYFETVYCLLTYGDKRKACYKTVLLAAALCMLYAVSDEFHQSFSDGRTPAVRDVIIDTCGGFAGSISAFFLCAVPKKEK